MISREELPKLIEEYLTTSGRTKTSLCEELGIKVPSLIGWLKGKTKPSYENYMKLIKILGVEEK